MFNFCYYYKKRFEMKIKYFIFLACTLIMLSCNNDVPKEDLVIEQINSMNGKELVRELLIENDKDYEQLSRIFKCSPDSLRRIQAGDTLPTANAKIELKKLLKSVKVIGNEAFQEVDPKYKTAGYRLINFTRLKISIIIIAIISFALWVWAPFNAGPFNGGILFIIGGILTFLLFYFLLIPGIGYLIYWIESIFSSKLDIIDNYHNTLDPIWEKIL